MRKQIHLFVSGRVQGVYFRAETKAMADRLDLSGWVRNLRDGRVETVFQGEEEAVETMIAWCGKGPVFAAVDRVEMEEEPLAGDFDGFTIRYS